MNLSILSTFILYFACHNNTIAFTTTINNNNIPYLHTTRSDKNPPSFSDKIIHQMQTSGGATTTNNNNKQITKDEKEKERQKITIFSITNCKYCNKAKALLTNKSLTFTEINIEHYPKKRDDMIELSKGSFTVPQIFIGNRLIGGSDDLEELFDNDKWDDILDEWYASSASGDFELDDRLSIPSYPPVLPNEEQSLHRNEDTFNYLKYLLPTQDSSSDDTIPEYVQIADMLANNLINESMRNGQQKISNADLKEYLSTRIPEDGDDKEMFVNNMITELIEYQMIIPIQINNKVDDDKLIYYRLQQFHTPLILNSYRIWNTKEDDDTKTTNDPFTILNNLKSKIDTLKNKYIDAKTGLTDYPSIKNDPYMSVIDEASCELQTIKLSSMNDDEKKTFCINLYNVMITHAFINVGIPTDTTNRGPFFENVGYVLGDKHFYSFSELENGVLRCNKIPPGKDKPFFESNDSRMNDICSKVDPRIHFALNCGAKSCPPIRKFTKEKINEELSIVSLAYCSDEVNNVKFSSWDKNDSTDKPILYLNQIFNWYSSDFGLSNTEIAETIVQWLSVEKKEILEEFLKNSDSDVALEFLPYDWTSDALSPIPFNLEEYE